MAHQKTSGAVTLVLDTRRRTGDGRTARSDVGGMLGGRDLRPGIAGGLRSPSRYLISP